jgi:NhaP-type Na+/H+ or K+/H+ antiporter
MNFPLLYLVVGGLFVVMALAGSLLNRLPLTTAIVYLGVGFFLGLGSVRLIEIAPVEQAPLLERITEVAVIISLFTAGLKLRTPLSDGRWWLPVRLAFGSMLVTVGLVALIGTLGLGLPLGAAILLGAVLAPTDPVLAADVQLEKPWDRDRLRFALTGEAGLNDGMAFPFVMLGLGLLGLHEIGPLGLRWLTVDVLWAVAAGLGVGALLGTLIGRLVLYQRREHKEAVGLDDFLALGLIALAYGAALLVHAYGFLAVFAAGLALRRIELQANRHRPPEDVEAMALAGEAQEVATDPEKAAAYMTQAALGVNEQLERIAEVLVVVLVGVMLSTIPLLPQALWFVPLLLLGVRPFSVWIGLLGTRRTRLQRGLISWFGIRGIGSIYYLSFAITHGLPAELAVPLTALTLVVVAVSVVVHGVSVTPLMSFYASQRTPRRAPTT